ncbi:PPC domain-containing DNA-binding protein [Chloroflexota bacterium]
MFKKVHVFRVKPKQELASEIASYCHQNSISSGVVIGIIGSAASAKLNFLRELPAKYETKEYKGPLEIVCAQGSVALKATELIIHVHIQLSGSEGCQGGHLVEATIFSTAEVTIGELDYQLYRYTDDYTGLNELQLS